jgi:hypothetical protein
MIEIDEDRARAAECLRMAKRAGNEDEEQSWLVLAESWLQSAQIRQISATPNIYMPPPARSRNVRRSSGANWRLQYAAVLALGTCFILGVWLVIKFHYIGWATY